jgi:fatty-acyl-CoA synthase
MPGIAEWIDRHATHTPDAPAIRFQGAEISYGELAGRCARMARFLAHDLGLGAGERVAYLGPNTPEQLVLTFAAARAGLIVVPLNWRLAAPELAAILANAEPAVLIVEAGFVEAVPAILPNPCPCRVYGIGETAGLPLLSDAVGDCDGPAPDRGASGQPLLIVYTSGTTGQPKGTVLSQAAVACNALNSIHMHGLTARDHVLTVLPMFHVGGLNIQTLPALSCGATVTLHARFDAGATLGAIAADRPTLTLLVPATMQAMIGHPAWATTDLSSLRAVATGSTDVPVPLIEAFHARSVPVIQVYGSTETGPVCLYQQPGEAFETVGSIGRAARHSDIRLIDEAGREVADGTPGEILVRGGNVAEGYWRQPELTAAAFRDGWYHSGDVALRDERELYWFKDRIKNVIISGGENIYPAELERILHGLPGIAEAAVVGRADARWGEVPVAVVALSDEAVTREAILAAFEGRIARYKAPKDVLFVAALPRNAMGKIDVASLRRIAGAHDEWA